MSKIQVNDIISVSMRTTYDVRPDKVEEFIAVLESYGSAARIENITDCLKRVADRTAVNDYSMSYKVFDE